MVSYLQMVQLLSIHTTASLMFPAAKDRDNWGTQLFFIDVYRILNPPLLLYVSGIMLSVLTTTWMIDWVWRSLQILINCCFQSSVLNQAYLLIPSRLHKIFYFVNSFLFFKITYLYPGTIWLLCYTWGFIGWRVLLLI